MAEETILYDGFFWTAIDGNIDYAALNQILGNVNQDTEKIRTDTDVSSSLDGVTMEVTEYSDAEVSMTSQIDISVSSFWNREGAVSLSAEDAAVVSNLVEDANWMEGTGDCLNDYIIFMGGEEIQYHSDCGTLNDTVNEKSFHLTEEQQAAVNAILEKYIALGNVSVTEEKHIQNDKLPFLLKKGLRLVHCAMEPQIFEDGEEAVIHNILSVAKPLVI